MAPATVNVRCCLVPRLSSLSFELSFLALRCVAGAGSPRTQISFAFCSVQPIKAAGCSWGPEGRRRERREEEGGRRRERREGGGGREQLAPGPRLLGRLQVVYRPASFPLRTPPGVHAGTAVGQPGPFPSPSSRRPSPRPRGVRGSLGAPFHGDPGFSSAEVPRLPGSRNLTVLPARLQS